MKKNLAILFSVILLSAMAGVGLRFVFAFSEPSGSPPSNNTAPPLTVSSIGQTKTGGLNVATSSGALGVGGAASGNYKLEVIGGSLTGIAGSTSGTNTYAITGVASGSATGVSGSSVSGTGLYGISTSGTGVSGLSSSSTGGLFYSSGGTYGVYGSATSTTALTYGGYFKSKSSTSGSAGAYAINTSTTGSVYGLYAQVNSTNASSAAVYGRNTGGGWAGYFEGPARVTGNLTIDGTITVGGGGAVFGSGTANYLAKWTAGSSIGNSIIFDNGTNVGIGTATPQKTLDVRGTGFIGSYYENSGATLNIEDTNNPYVTIVDQGTGTLSLARDGNAYVAWDNGNLYFKYGGTWNAHPSGSGITAMTISSSGNVGIGTTSPTQALEVSSGYVKIKVKGTSSDAWMWADGFGGNNSGFQAGTDGTIRVQIDGAPNQHSWFNTGGNVGIGTTSPGAKLDVLAANATAVRVLSGASASYTSYGLGRTANESSWGIAAGPIQFADFATAGDTVLRSLTEDLILTARNATGAIRFGTGAADTEKMTITNAGNVGIGTTSPAYKLDVFGTASFSQPVIVGTPTAASHAATKSYVDSTIGGGGASGSFATLTVTGNTYLATTSGNVGIGTTGPGSGLTGIAKLHIKDSTATNLLYAMIESTVSGAEPGVAFRVKGGNTGADWFIGTNRANFGGASDSFFFYKNEGIIGTKLVIQDNGNVGIGTTSPAYKLDVNGNTRITGNLTVTGTVSYGSIGADWLNANYGVWSNSDLYMDVDNDNTPLADNAFIVRDGQDKYIFRATESRYLQLYDTATTTLFIANSDGSIQTKGAIFPGTTATTQSTASIYSPSGALAFSTNLTEKMRIDSTGNVGIGTTNPSRRLTIGDDGTTANASHVFIDGRSNNENYTLQSRLYLLDSNFGVGAGRVAGAGAGPASLYFWAPDDGATDHDIRFMDVDTATGGDSNPNGAAWTTNMVIKRTGNVGIGTTGPQALLEVRKDQAAYTPLIVNNANAGQWAGFDIYKGTSRIATMASDNTTINIGSPAGSTLPISFIVADSKKVTIDTQGNVGIGTTSPTQVLDVRGTIKNVAIGSNSSFLWGNGVANDIGSLEGGTLGEAVIRAQQNDIFFKTPLSSNVMILKNSGNVGIGTTGPGYKLDVAGVAKVASGVGDALKIGGSSIPMGLQTEGGGTTPLLNLDINFRQSDKNTTYLGAVNRIDARYPSVNLFQWLYRAAGTTSEYELMALNPGALYVNSATGVNNIKLDAGGGTSYINSGNVGIGTTSPSEKLHVQGNARITGNLQVDGTINLAQATYTQTSTATSGSVYNLSTSLTANPGLASSAIYYNSLNQLFTQSGNIQNFTGYLYSGYYQAQHQGTGTVSNLYGLQISYNNTSTGTVSNAIGLRISSANTGLGSITANYGLLIDDLPGTSAAAIYQSGSNDVNYFAGNVGIGTTGPGAKLDVVGNGRFGASSNIRLQSSVADTERPISGGLVSPAGNISINAGDDTGTSATTGIYYYNSGWKSAVEVTNTVTNLLLMKSGGNVGIGTTSPATILTISSTPGIDNTVSTGIIRLINNINCPIGCGGNTGARIEFYSAQGVGSPAPPVEMARIGTLLQNGTAGLADADLAFYAINDGTLTEAMRIQGDTGNVGIGTTSPGAKLDIEGNLQFFTTTPYAYIMALNGRKLAIGTDPGGSIVVDTSGNVGIGTTAPGILFHVRGGDATGNIMRLENPNTGGYTTINYVGTGRTWNAGVGGSTVGDGSANKFYIHDGTASAFRMVIDTSGNVGIGTTSPSEKLHVQGNARITGNLQVDGTINLAQATYTQTSTATTGSVYNLSASLTANPPLASSATYYNNLNSLYIPSGNIQNFTGNLYSGYFYAEHGGTGAVSNLFGLQAYPRNNSTGTITNAYGINVNVVNNAIGGTITNATGLRISFSNSGTMTNSYGIVIDDLPGSAAAVYQSGSNDVNYFAGNVGIGTTAPTRLLHAVGTKTGVPLVNFQNLSATGDGLFVQAETTSSSQYALRVDNQTTVGILYVRGDGNVGIGTTSPIGKFNVHTNATDNSFQGITVSNEGISGARAGIAFKAYDWVQGAIWHGRGAGAYSGALVFGTNPNTTDLTIGGVVSRMVIDNTGNVGIGTTSPTVKLDVNGSARISGTLDMNGNNISGVNKLTVTTIDPEYTFDGKKYATYVASFAGGVKEETTGKVQIKCVIARSEATKQSNEIAALPAGARNDKCEYVIDFDKVEEGSDLWLWRKVIDFSKDNVEVLATPYGEFAMIAYQIEDNKLVFKSDKAVEISYRLTGRRHDWKLWPTMLK